MNKLELAAANVSLPNVAVWANRWEKERFTRALKKWQRDNPKSTLEQEEIFFSWWYLATLERRLQDARVFYDGTPTTWISGSMPAEEIERKQAELKEHLPTVQKMKIELLKLAMASSVSLQITGDAKSVTSLFKAHDVQCRKECQQ